MNAQPPRPASTAAAAGPAARPGAASLAAGSTRMLVPALRAHCRFFARGTAQ